MLVTVLVTKTTDRPGVTVTVPEQSFRPVGLNPGSWSGERKPEGRNKPGESPVGLIFDGPMVGNAPVASIFGDLIGYHGTPDESRMFLEYAPVEATTGLG